MTSGGVSLTPQTPRSLIYKTGYAISENRFKDQVTSREQM